MVLIVLMMAMMCFTELVSDGVMVAVRRVRESRQSRVRLVRARRYRFN